MKKPLVALLVLLSLTFTTAMDSCTKVVTTIVPLSCTTLLADYTLAETASLAAPNDVVKCQAVKTAAQKYINGCPSMLAVERKALQDQINSACK